MTNVGNADRGLRFVLGLTLLLAPLMPLLAGFFAGWGAWTYAVHAVGIILILTALLRFCPVYTLLGINTCKRRA